MKILCEYEIKKVGGAQFSRSYCADKYGLLVWQSTYYYPEGDPGRIDANCVGCWFGNSTYSERHDVGVGVPFSGPWYKANGDMYCDAGPGVVASDCLLTITAP